jgi:osmotically-inducible protein OsmY
MADRYFDPERWRYSDEERYRDDVRPRFGDRESERGWRERSWTRGERSWPRAASERDWPRRGERGWATGERDWRHDDERSFFDRFGDEVRSWFGDEDAQRRRRMDERDDRWREPRERGGDRWESDDVARQWGYIDRGEWRGQDWGRATSGRFGGLGPRGWQRSDDRIKEDLCERMSEHPYLDASDIEIRVVSSEVTLTGSVDNRYAKRLAEDIAESVSGVRDVHNQIRVNSRTEGQDAQPPQPGQRGLGGERRIA